MRVGINLISRRPVAVAAAEDAVLDAGEGVGRQSRIAQLLAEFRGVVRRLAVVRGGDDHDGALLGQRVGVLVERPDRGAEAPDPRVVGDAVRDALGCAEIGAEQHQERRRMRVCRRSRIRGRRGRSRSRNQLAGVYPAAPWTGDVAEPRPSVDVKRNCSTGYYLRSAFPDFLCSEPLPTTPRFPNDTTVPGARPPRACLITFTFLASATPKPWKTANRKNPERVYGACVRC